MPKIPTCLPPKIPQGATARAFKQDQLQVAENVTFNDEGQVLQSYFILPEAIQN